MSPADLIAGVADFGHLRAAAPLSSEEVSAGPVFDWLWFVLFPLAAVGVAGIALAASRKLLGQKPLAAWEAGTLGQSDAGQAVGLLGCAIALLIVGAGYIFDVYAWGFVAGVVFFVGVLVFFFLLPRLPLSDDEKMIALLAVPAVLAIWLPLAFHQSLHPRFDPGALWAVIVFMWQMHGS